MDDKERKYGSWLNRLLAYIIDLILVMIFIVPMNYLNITGAKNFYWFASVILTSISYKPLMELYYKKTLGKYFLELNVVDTKFTRINVGQAYLRNVFFIFPSLLSMPFYYIAFNDPTLEHITDFGNFAAMMPSKFPLQKTLTSIALMLLILDFIFIFFDKKKQNKALHDIFAKTLVLQKPK